MYIFCLSGEKFNTKVDKGKLAQMLSELVQQLTRESVKRSSSTEIDSNNY